MEFSLTLKSTMAETSEPESGFFDPKTMRKTKPGLKRLILTLSVLFSFLLAFPFLWKSVEIYRASLPFREIESLSTRIQSDPISSFPCEFQAIFLGFDPKSANPDALKSSITDKITKLTSNSPQFGSCSQNVTVSVTVEAGDDCKQSKSGKSGGLFKCGGLKGVEFVGDDNLVDEALDSVLGGFRGYTVVVVNRGEEEEEVKSVAGKYRHGWIIGRVSEDIALSRVAEVFVKVFVNGGTEEGELHSEFMPVGADGRIAFSFNLLNADPRDWIYDWDFQRIDETWLTPIIKALGPVANISVESQVLYHTPKSSFSYWDENQNSHIFTTKDLPFFVNSNEWHLDTSVAAGGRSKILHFVVYIPSAKECPLNLQLTDGKISKTNGFISPMWGGIVVWNPQGCLKGSKTTQIPRHMLSPQDMEKVFHIFMGQFRQLFGFKSDNFSAGESGIITLLPSEKGFTEWELDLLARKHTCFNLRSAASTLESLSKLVQSLPRMIIKDEIGKQVKFSLEAARLAESNVSFGDHEASAVFSRQARSLAEDAFFHPSIMSVSYFSLEHCFAVYSPFFFPVCLHVLAAVAREWKRYRQEKTKYLTWTAKVKRE